MLKKKDAALAWAVQNWDSISDRFWSKTVSDPATGCRIWQGAKDSGGYGQFSVATPSYGSVAVLAHRLSYAAAGNPLVKTQDGLQMVVVHRCGNSGCVEPSHLRLLPKGYAWALRKKERRKVLSGDRRSEEVSGV